MFCVECGGRMPGNEAAPPPGLPTVPDARRSTAPLPPPSLAPKVLEGAPPTLPPRLDGPLPPPPLTARGNEPVAPPPPLTTRSSEPAAPPRPSAPALPTLSRPAPPRRSTLPGGGALRSLAPAKPGASPGTIAEALSGAAAENADQGSVPPEPQPSVATLPPPPPPLLPTPTPVAAPRSDEIDRRFETLQSHPPADAKRVEASDLEEAQRLFLEISVNYLGPVRDLIVEIDLGEPTKEWLGICRPSVGSMLRAARELELGELAQRLDEVLTALEHAERGPGAGIEPRAREALRAAYDKLVALLPAAFGVKEERDRREPVIVQSLLQQVSDVRKVALDRIYAAGLTSLELFYKAKPQDISDAAGISRELAERIVARFHRYRRELASVPPVPRKNHDRSQLELLTKRLEDQNSAFEASSKGWSSSEEKRRLRQERAGTVIELNLILARMGEMNLVRELERLPFTRKAEELRRFLATRSN